MPTVSVETLSSHGPIPRLAADAMPSDLDSFMQERLSAETGDLYAETRDFVDRRLFTRVLERTRGNHRAAAALLGISRQTMRVRLRALGIRVGHGDSSLIGTGSGSVYPAAARSSSAVTVESVSRTAASGANGEVSTS